MSRNNESDAGKFRDARTAPLAKEETLELPKEDDDRKLLVKNDAKYSGKFEERRHLKYDKKWEYPREGTEPGTLLIFYQETFKDDSHDKRNGGRRDVNEIIICFQRLGFNITEENICCNFTKAEILDKLETESKNDFTDTNCLIIFFLTHGSSKNQLSAYDDDLNVKDVWSPFGKSKGLTGKPKMFVFQACKAGGGEEEFSYTAKRVQDEKDVIVKLLPIEDFKGIPADTVLVYSTTEDTKAFRHPLTGSWFIQELCKNFSSKSEHSDVISLLIRTTKCISMNYYDGSVEQRKQMPVFVSTLRKKFYINRNKHRDFLVRMYEELEKNKGALENIEKLFIKV